jgi:hypothetical protein
MHTPEPWIADTGLEVFMEDQAAMLVDGVGTDREWMAVGRPCTDAESGTIADVVALCHPSNAHVIAAAPDLLAALVKVQLALACYRDDQPFIHNGRQLALEEVKYLLVDPVIDKALGESVAAGDA